MSYLIVLVHPEDMNVADAKALAAKWGASLEPNRFMRRGQFFLTSSEVLDFPTPPAPSEQPAQGDGGEGA